MRLPTIKATMTVTLLACQSLYAQPGSGIRIGEQTVLTPEANFSINYNDNVNLRRRAVSEGGEILDNRDSDTFFNTQLSLSLRRWASQTQWNGRMWYGDRRYNDNSNLDRETYGLSGGVFWVNPAATRDLNWNASFQRAADRTEQNIGFVGDAEVSDELENVAERVERDEIRSNISVGQSIGTTLRATAAYHITDITYNEERFNDRTSHLFSGELTYRITPRTTPYLRAGIGFDDDEGLDGHAERPFYLIGVRLSPTEKLNMDVAVGYESFTRRPLEFRFTDANEVELLPGDRLRNSGLKFTASIQYAATPKSRFSLSARNGYGSVASPGSSSREELSFSASFNHQTTRQISQRLSVAWREDNYLTPLPARGEEWDELKETIWYQYRIDYQTIRPWLSVFGNISYEDGSSRIPGDSYTETQVTAGVSVRY
jgi:hypothetical protein